MAYVMNVSSCQQLVTDNGTIVFVNIFCFILRAGALNVLSDQNEVSDQRPVRTGDKDLVAGAQLEDVAKDGARTQGVLFQ